MSEDGIRAQWNRMGIGLPFDRVIVGTTRPIHRIRGDFEDVCYPDLKTRWLIGGRLVSNEDEFSYTFEKAGEYLITCKLYDKKYNLLDARTKKVIAVMPKKLRPQVHIDGHLTPITEKYK